MFEEIEQADPACAMAYWGAAMTYNHPFWDAPTPEDLAAAWAHAQKGLAAKSQNDREHMYLLAVAALYKDGGAERRRRRAIGPIASRWPPPSRSIRTTRRSCSTGCRSWGTSPRARRASRVQSRAIRRSSSPVYAHDKQHPGVLHYLIHAYDDPVHAEAGLAAARV